jgi:hypothetical protein
MATRLRILLCFGLAITRLSCGNYSKYRIITSSSSHYGKSADAVSLRHLGKTPSINGMSYNRLPDSMPPPCAKERTRAAVLPPGSLDSLSSFFYLLASSALVIEPSHRLAVAHWYCLFGRCGIRRLLATCLDRRFAGRYRMHRTVSVLPSMGCRDHTGRVLLGT